MANAEILSTAEAELKVQDGCEKDNMEPQEDVNDDIPKDRVKFFGGTGKMLLPSPATVAALIKKIPKRKLITTNLLCKELTGQFKVRGTCPVTTQKALHQPHDKERGDGGCRHWREVVKVVGADDQLKRVERAGQRGVEAGVTVRHPRGGHRERRVDVQSGARALLGVA